MVKLVHDFIDHPLGISPALLVSFDVGEFVAFPLHLPRGRVDGIETDVALFALVESRVRVRKDFSVWTHFFWRLFWRTRHVRAVPFLSRLRFVKVRDSLQNA